MTRLLAITLAAALVSACGDDADEVTGAMTAACDWSADVAKQSCQQVTGPAVEVRTGERDCPAEGGVFVSRCPAADDLVGCCSHPAFGMAMTWCYYDATLHATKQSGCNALTVIVDGQPEPAVWTTTVPLR